MLSEALGPVTCAALSPANDLIITGEKNGAVKVWGLMDLAILESLKGHSAPVTGVGFLADGSRAYSASLDGVVRFHDRAKNDTFELPQMDPITAVDVVGDGSVAVVGESRREGIEEDEEYWNVSGWIAGCRGGAVSAWDIASQWSAYPLAPLDAPIWRIELADHKIDLSSDSATCPTFLKISPDSRFVAFSRIPGGQNPGELEIVGLRDGALAGPRYWGSPDNSPVAAEFSADGEKLIIVTWALFLREREITNQINSGIALEEHEELFLSASRSRVWSAPSAVSLAANDRYILIGNRFGDIRLYDIPARKRLEEMSGHTREVTSVRFFHNNSYALSAAMDGSVRIWRLPELEA